MTQLGWFGALRAAVPRGLGWPAREHALEQDVPRETSPTPVTTAPPAEAPGASGLPEATEVTEPAGPAPGVVVEVPPTGPPVGQATSGTVPRGTTAETAPEEPGESAAPSAADAAEAVAAVREAVERDEERDVEGRADPVGLPEPAAVPRETARALRAERFPRPTETRVLTIANQKGGVGKTTTAVNLASALSAAGLKVLVLDLDPQGNASTALGIDHHTGVPGVYEVLVEGKPLAEVVQRCDEAPELWCAPATVDLAGAEIELVSMVARESRLQRALAKYLRAAERSGEGRVDYVLIDCPPSLGLLTINAFVAAPEVLIPIQCEYYALEGLSQLLANIELIQEHLNPDLTVSTILLTMYDGRTRLAAQVVDEVRQHFGGQVLRALVPRSVRISEAPSHGQTVMTYDPLSSGALAYLEAAREIAQRGAEQAPAAEEPAAGSAAPAADPWSRWTDGTGSRRSGAPREGGA